MTTSTITYDGKLRTSCTHCKSDTKIITDAPIDNHGQGESFSPTDLLSTALVSCMFTIMGIKAAENNISLGTCSADMTKVMTNNPRRVSEIQVKIKVQSEMNLTSEQKKLLEDAALNCPVAKSLDPAIKQMVDFVYV
jgi:putative redox protein